MITSYIRNSYIHLIVNRKLKPNSYLLTLVFGFAAHDPSSEFHEAEQRIHQIAALFVWMDEEKGYQNINIINITNT